MYILTNNDIGRRILPSIAGYNLFSGKTTDPDLIAAALYFWYESRSNNPRTGIAIRLPTSRAIKLFVSLSNSTYRSRFSICSLSKIYSRVTKHLVVADFTYAIEWNNDVAGYQIFH